MITMPEKVTLSTLADRYDVFFIDQFGVLRDGERAYTGAAAALAALKSTGKTIVILSNSGRSGDYNATRLEGLGFERSSFDHFVTSGDVAISLLQQGSLPVSANKDTRCFTISSGGDRNLVEKLGLAAVECPEDADLIILSGSETETISLDRYRTMLCRSAERGVPCICTNPDLEKLSGGSLLPSAGAIAALYEDMGGPVTRVGKPYLPIYRHAHAVCGFPELSRIICIGDSPEHDILGARTFGADSVLTRTGVNAGMRDEDLIGTLQDIDLVPTFLIEAFA
ncbi:TIGR01459 family HAD-type hydrolase [Rhizobium rhizogenes]|uniref:TIGR01459 family HAD-type hydrolase n=1 Tax=Rhizobium rhizogenes TaxID=359 RepID=UPI0015721701|nr:TIGR01459 family HAD-type hydrolase [Rhizobium rhizogenes]NTI26463.1 TIGR01459 family HAD-type hydrolase [Rhizobium rhizogenes]NTI65845.1 TIGR01459 family HAD-type hydrolase [Rhizobium rhizogenes]QTG08750.1 TIGR01459 family HAD-type hydrolase [Rhizobium rhizogenes]